MTIEQNYCRVAHFPYSGRQVSPIQDNVGMFSLFGEGHWVMVPHNTNISATIQILLFEIV